VTKSATRKSMKERDSETTDKGVKNMEDQQKRIISWSGGKDSTATIILAHEMGIKIDEVITCFVWFDKKRGIYGEPTEKLDWMINHAKPIIESWGYPVKIISSDKDYLYWFNHIRKKSTHPEFIGKRYGFVMGGRCKMQGEKVTPIRRYKKEHFPKAVEYVGICADEPERLERMTNRQQRSLLAENGLTQFDAIQKCKDYKLLLPTYNAAKRRDGCWFCPNQKLPEMAETKQKHPELWEELRKLSKYKDVISRSFKYGKTFDEVDREVDEYIKNPPPVQLTFFDIPDL